MKQSQSSRITAIGPAVAAAAAAATFVLLYSFASVEKRDDPSSRRAKCSAQRAEYDDATSTRAGIVLTIDIGSSSVRCSAYTLGGEGGEGTVLVPGSAAQIARKIVKDDGCGDAREVIELVDQVVDQCFSELRRRGISHTVRGVGFACFGMNLVGIGADGQPCTPVYTYANSNRNSSIDSVARGSFFPPLADETVAKRLKDAIDRTGPGGQGGLEQTRQRTGTPNTHVSYAPVQLLKLVLRRPGIARRVKHWQTLPSLVAARWCCLSSAPISYSEASWTGLLNFRTLEWDAPTLAVLREAGFDTSSLPRLADVGGLRASASGRALKRWPELDGVNIHLGVGDGAAACLGSGCDETSGQLSVTVGTSAAARVVLRIPPTATEAAGAVAPAPTAPTEFHVPSGLWCYRLDRNRAVLGGSLTDGGSVFEWMRNTLGFQTAPVKGGVEGGADGDENYGLDAVMQEAEKMAPASHGLVILPFFSGERSPGYHDNATACILGLSRSTTRAQLLRAGLESVCLRLAAVVELMVSGNSERGSSKRAAVVGRETAAAAAAGGEVYVPPPTHSGDQVAPDAQEGVRRGGGGEGGSRRASETPRELLAIGDIDITTTAAATTQSVAAPPETLDLGQSNVSAWDDDMETVPLTPTTPRSRGGHPGSREPKKQEAIRVATIGVVSSDTKVVTSGRAMAASPVWQQILADCLGRTVLQDAAETEQTSLGVAVLLAALREDEKYPAATNKKDNEQRRQRQHRGKEQDGELNGEGVVDNDDEPRGGGSFGGAEDRGAVVTGRAGAQEEAVWGVVLRRPNEHAFRRYASARQAQERVYLKMIE